MEDPLAQSNVDLVKTTLREQFYVHGALDSCFKLVVELFILKQLFHTDLDNAKSMNDHSTIREGLYCKQQQLDAPRDELGVDEGEHALILNLCLKNIPSLLVFIVNQGIIALDSEC